MKAAHLVAIGAGGVLAFLVLAKGKDAARAVGQAVNPLSDQNLAYRGTTAVVQSLAGNDYDTLGTWLHRKFSGDDERVAAMLNPPAPTVYRTSDADAIVSTSFTDPMGNTWA